MTRPKLPVVRLMARWVERLNQDYEVVRVLMVGDDAVYRVVPHRNATWRAEQHRRGGSWSAVRGNQRGKFKCRVERVWRSPAAAMRAVEALVEVAVPQPGEGATKEHEHK